MDFTGSSAWRSGDDEYEAEALTADMAEGSFSLRFTNCGLEYSAVLKPSENPGVVVGEWRLVGAPLRTGQCVARVYSSEGGYFVLVGSWVESGIRYEWLTKLRLAR